MFSPTTELPQLQTQENLHPGAARAIPISAKNYAEQEILKINPRIVISRNILRVGLLSIVSVTSADKNFAGVKKLHWDVTWFKIKRAKM